MEDESFLYHSAMIPLIKTYKTLEDIPRLIEEALSDLEQIEQDAKIRLNIFVQLRLGSHQRNC